MLDHADTAASTRPRDYDVVRRAIRFLSES